MKLDDFYVIQYPDSFNGTTSHDSFMFQTNAKNFALQIKGGFNADRIIATCTDEDEAKAAAMIVSAAYNKFKSVIQQLKKEMGE